jgi:hypothetical protein
LYHELTILLHGAQFIISLTVFQNKASEKLPAVFSEQNFL